jgi:hypothetical protein
LAGADHPKLRIAKARDSDDLNLVDLLRWLGQSRPLSDDEVRIGLKRWVSEYTVSQRPACEPSPPPICARPVDPGNLHRLARSAPYGVQDGRSNQELKIPPLSVLIISGAGYIGSHIVRHLSRVGDIPVNEVPSGRDPSSRSQIGVSQLCVQLGWQPRYDDLAAIFAGAWRWECCSQVMRGAMESLSQRPTTGQCPRFALSRTPRQINGRTC